MPPPEKKRLTRPTNTGAVARSRPYRTKTFVNDHDGPSARSSAFASPTGSSTSPTSLRTVPPCHQGAMSAVGMVRPVVSTVTVCPRSKSPRTMKLPLTPVPPTTSDDGADIEAVLPSCTRLSSAGAARLCCYCMYSNSYLGALRLPGLLPAMCWCAGAWPVHMAQHAAPFSASPFRSDTVVNLSTHFTKKARTRSATRPRGGGGRAAAVWLRCSWLGTATGHWHSAAGPCCSSCCCWAPETCRLLSSRDLPVGLSKRASVRWCPGLVAANAAGSSASYAVVYAGAGSGG
jgi:hypothetical protein